MCPEIHFGSIILVFSKQKDVVMKRIFLLLFFVHLCFLSGPVSVHLTLADQVVSGQKSNFEMLFWESVKDSNKIDMYRAYLKKYPNGVFVDLAKIKIQALQHDSMAEPGIKKDAKDVIHSPGIRLRSTPEILEEEDLKRMLKKYNFCDLKRNEKGDFKNVFKDNKDGTISDEATGLVWQQTGSWRKMSRKNIDAYIEDLNRQKFAGRSNWRLPTVEELASLIEQQYSNTKWLFIDPVFGDPGGDWIDKCWSADGPKPFGGADEAAWIVNFKYGIIDPAIWVNSEIGSWASRNKLNFVRTVSSIKQ